MRPVLTVDEPDAVVVSRSAIPSVPHAGLPKFYWHAVVRRLLLLTPGEALRVEARGSVSSARSSLHGAAAALGVRLCIVVRDPYVYTWARGRRQPSGRARPPRQDMRCRACGRRIQRPPTGGSVQFYCAGPAGQPRTACQVVGRLASVRGLSLEDAKRLSTRWRREGETCQRIGTLSAT